MININIIQPRSLYIPSIRLLHIFHKNKSPINSLYQPLAIQQSIRSNGTDQSSSSVLIKKFNREKIPSNFTLRLIQSDEFTNEFEHLVFRTFLKEEPMGKYFGLTQPDECIMLFLRQILQRAKQDNVSLGIYDESNNNKKQQTNMRDQDNVQQSAGHQQNLPICYVINHIENVDDPPEKNDFRMDLSKAPIELRPKYQYIGDILSNIVENFDIFTEYKARRIMQSYLAGIEPQYANQGLFTQLKIATIELARANKCDLIYSKATSQYSTRANLKLGYHKARAIDYSTFKNNKGEFVFHGISTTHLGCTLTVKDLRI